MTNKDSPLPPTVQQAAVGNNEKASHVKVDISELIREAYEVLRDFRHVDFISDVAAVDLNSLWPVTEIREHPLRGSRELEEKKQTACDPDAGGYNQTERRK